VLQQTETPISKFFKNRFAELPFERRFLRLLNWQLDDSGKIKEFECCICEESVSHFLGGLQVKQSLQPQFLPNSSLSSIVLGRLWCSVSGSIRLKKPPKQSKAPITIRGSTNMSAP